MNATSNPSYTGAIEQLLRSPWLPKAVQQLQNTLESERQKRQHFYDDVTEHHKAEFINGEIIVHSPAKLQHTLARKHLVMLLSAYVQKNQLGLVGDEKMLITFERNDYEPDICFFGTEKAQGFSPDQMQFPAPDFIIEVLSPSTVTVDRGIKFEDYAANGVREYWLVDPESQTVEQYGLVGSSYELLTKLREGDIRSEVVKGFGIPLLAIFDPQKNLMTLQKLLA